MFRVAGVGTGLWYGDEECSNGVARRLSHLNRVISVVSVLPGVFGLLRSSTMGFRVVVVDARLLERVFGRCLWDSGEALVVSVSEVVEVVDRKDEVLGWFVRVRLMRTSSKEIRVEVDDDVDVELGAGVGVDGGSLAVFDLD